MSFNKNLAAAFAAFLAVVVLMLSWIFMDDSGTKPPPSKAKAPTSGAAKPERKVVPVADVASLGRWELGAVRTYKVSLSQSVTVQGKEGASAVSKGSLEADLLVAVTEKVGEKVALRVALNSAVLEGDAWPEARRAELKADLGTPGFALLTQRGTLESVHVVKGVSPAAQRLLRAVLADFQVVLSEGEGWSEEEPFSGGVQAVRYERKAPGVLSKQRVAYKTFNTPGLTAARVTGGLQSTIALGDDKWPDKIDLTDTETHAAGKGMPGIASSRTVGFVRKTTQRADMLIGSFGRAKASLVVVGGGKAGAKLGERARTGQDADLVSGATFEGLVKALGAAKAGRELSEAQKRLEAWLRVHPKAAEGLKASIRSGAGSALSQRMMAALAAAGNDASRVALIGLMEDPTPGWDDQAGAAALLLGLSQPASTASLAALEKIGPEHPVWARAVLGVGVQASRLRATEPEATEAAVDGLIAGFKASKDAAQRRQYMTALGNSGDPKILPIVTELVASKDDQIRAAAAFALRFVPGDEAGALLKRYMDDPSEAVKAKAQKAQAFRESKGP